jgi:ATP-dependent Clp protease ATP-binding subunit ClpA
MEGFMYERFTDRSRRVMALANQSAQRFQNEFIGTEHVLWGILNEGSGVGANLLLNLGVDVRKVQADLEEAARSAGGTSSIGRLPQTPQTKKAIEFAIAEARDLNHNYVGTEHLLLGLLRLEDGVAAEVLGRVDVTFDRVKQEHRRLVGAGALSDAESDPIPDELIQRHKDHPLVDRYRALLNGLKDTKESFIAAREYGKVASYRDQEYVVRGQFRRLLQMLDDEAGAAP